MRYKANTKLLAKRKQKEIVVYAIAVSGIAPKRLFQYYYAFVRPLTQKRGESKCLVHVRSHTYIYIYIYFHRVARALSDIMLRVRPDDTDINIQNRKKTLNLVCWVVVPKQHSLVFLGNLSSSWQVPTRKYLG